MQSVNLNQLSKNGSFTDLICQHSGQMVRNCYQCGKCTAGCPVAPDMDIMPNQIVRMVQLGLKEEVLGSQTIWICAFCSTCTVRCPRNVDLARLMETLRIQAGREGVAVKGRGRNVRIFTGNFLDSVKKFGRMFEFGTMVGYNLKSGKPFKEGDTGLALLQRRKLRFFPEKPAGMDEITRIFERVSRMEEGKN